jgi:hypothetical protein
MVIGNKTTAQCTRTTINQSINQLNNQSIIYHSISICAFITDFFYQTRSTHVKINN